MSHPKKGTKEYDIWRKRIGEANTGKTHNQDVRAKISLSLMGNTRRLGTKQPEEYKKMMSIRMSGENNPFYGRRHTPETLQILSLAKTGSNHPNFGKRLKPETIEKLKVKRRGWKTPVWDTKPERIMEFGLIINGISYKKQKLIHVGKFQHRVDFFIEPNICIEVDGDYIHGNPRRFKPDQKIGFGRIVKDVWVNDEKINFKLKELGFIIMRFWEYDIIKDVQKIINILNMEVKV